MRQIQINALFFHRNKQMFVLLSNGIIEEDQYGQMVEPGGEPIETYFEHRKVLHFRQQHMSYISSYNHNQHIFSIVSSTVVFLLPAVVCGKTNANGSVLGIAHT